MTLLSHTGLDLPKGQTGFSPGANNRIAKKSTPPGLTEPNKEGFAKAQKHKVNKSKDNSNDNRSSNNSVNNPRTETLTTASNNEKL